MVVLIAYSSSTIDFVSSGFEYIKPNTHRRRDSTVELSRVGGVYGIRN